MMKPFFSSKEVKKFNYIHTTIEELYNLYQLIWNNQYGIVGNHYPIHGDPLNPISRSKENENPQYASYFFPCCFVYTCADTLQCAVNHVSMKHNLHLVRLLLLHRASHRKIDWLIVIY